MKFGINTLCLYGSNLDDIITFAAKNGFSALEIPCTPRGQKGIHHLDVEDVKEKGHMITGTLKNEGVEISCLSYYANPLAGNAEAEEYAAYMEKLIDAAHLMSVPYISTFTGYSPGHHIGENLDMFAAIFKPLLKTAQEKGVGILLENTPMMAGHSYGGNFAFSPEHWEMIFDKLPDENLGLNFDPSHLFWMGIDYNISFRIFRERIFHFQAKDSEILLENLRICGIYGSNWFRYRLPGHGSIDWKALLATMHETGYEGVISVENEDVFWWKNPENIKRSFLLSRKMLNPYVV